MGDSQRGSFRESGNHSQFLNSFHEPQQASKKESKPQSSTPHTTYQNPEPNVADFFGSPMKPNIAMPSFGPDSNVMEVQNYLLFIMNFYEIHMNNLKGIVIQQNETITAQKTKIRKSEDAIEEFRDKIEHLQNNIKLQKDQYDQSYDELQEKHNQAMDELMSFKKNVDLISKQMDNSVLIKDELDRSHITHGGNDHVDSKASRMILNEIQEIRRELEYQRELINDFKHTKNSLEHQIRDLERIYHDELRNNADISSRHEQVSNTMKKYRESYVKFGEIY
jgi:chromosome segregation ATPase